MSMSCTNSWHSTSLQLSEVLEGMQVGEIGTVHNHRMKRVGLTSWRFADDNSDMNAYTLGEVLGKLIGMEYCPSCGDRSDGRRSLANLTGNQFGKKYTFTKGDQTMEASVQAILPQGFHMSSGQLISTEESHEWMVEDG